jgi:hypothetical protein
MVVNLKEGYWAAVIEVCYIGFGVEALFSYVAIVGCSKVVPVTWSVFAFQPIVLRIISYGSSIIICPLSVQHVNVTSVSSGKYETISQSISGHIRHSVLYWRVASSSVMCRSSDAFPQYARSSVSKRYQ